MIPPTLVKVQKRPISWDGVEVTYRFRLPVPWVRFPVPEPESPADFTFRERRKCLTTGTPTFAFQYNDLKPIIDVITGALSIENLVSVLAGVATTAIVFVFFWWGVRKASNVIMKAFKKGKLSI